jgi:outer membrane immunogenic protein
MRNKLTSSVVGAVFSFAVSGLAFAADPGAPIPAAAPSWTGFYLGVHAGWAWSSNESATQVETFGSHIITAPLLFNMDNDSPIAGLQAGYNYQFSRWVVGIEGDISGARLSTSQTGSLISVISIINCHAGDFCGSATVAEDIRWLASVRGRLGYAWDRGLLYVTGGGAWADVKYRGSTSSSLTGAPPLFASSFTSTVLGPVVGGGYEWMITPNWTLRGEFLHYWFDEAQAAAVTSSSAPGFAANYTWSRFDVNVARVAVNYKF